MVAHYCRKTFSKKLEVTNSAKINYRKVALAFQRSLFKTISVTNLANRQHTFAYRSSWPYRGLPQAPANIDVWMKESRYILPGPRAPAPPPPAGPSPRLIFQAPPPAGPSPRLHFQAPPPAGPCRGLPRAPADPGKIIHTGQIAR